MGLGALVAWSNLVRYFEFSPRFYVLVLTLERSMPDILRFMASCIPVLMGYVLHPTLLLFRCSARARRPNPQPSPPARRAEDGAAVPHGGRFAAMGMAIFGATVREFATVHAAMETLFALMNGDSVLQLLQVRILAPRTPNTIHSNPPRHLLASIPCAPAGAARPAPSPRLSDVCGFSTAVERHGAGDRVDIYQCVHAAVRVRHHEHLHHHRDSFV